MPSHVQRRSAAFLLLILLAGASAGIAQTQDLTGGVGVFSPRPRNPPAHPRRKTRRAAESPSKAEPREMPRAAPSPAPEVESREQGERDEASPPPSGKVLNEAVEEAIALGNSARDADPPRYEDAERAYRLALKLAPKDPRPHVGLANLYYDRQQFQKAAELYREALNLERRLHSEPQREERRAAKGAATPREKPRKGPRFSPRPPPVNPREMEWQTYLAATLTQHGQFREALAELSPQVEAQTKDDAIYAMAGSALFGLGRYTEAAAYVEYAARLAPGKAAYAEFLQRVRARQAEVAPLTEATRRELEGTKWVPREGRADEVCELRSRGEVRCEPPRGWYDKGRWKAEGDLIYLGHPRGSWLCVGSLTQSRLNFHCGYHGLSTRVYFQMDWVRAEK